MINKSMPNTKSLIIQPFIPNYREDFFLELIKIFNFNLFYINKPKDNESFKLSSELNIDNLNSIKIGKLVFFNIFSRKILQSRLIISSWSPQWISLYLLLLLKNIFCIKFIIWTHGVSVRHGFQPRSLRDKIKLFFFNRADSICFYTENELKQLSPYLLKPKLFYINNTLNVEKIQKTKSVLKNNSDQLKKKYGITSSRVIIHCARFIKDRRAELLVELIVKMINEDVSFIIIGSGQYKPDFSVYSSVFDFGALYDEKTKAELFSIADFSFQPAWSGLSVVESMANGVPYITLKKSKDILQCVEYNYIIHGFNGFIARNLKEVWDRINNTSNNELKKMKHNCIGYVNKELALSDIVNRFVRGLNT